MGCPTSLTEIRSIFQTKINVVHTNVDRHTYICCMTNANSKNNCRLFQQEYGLEKFPLSRPLETIKRFQIFFTHYNYDPTSDIMILDSIISDVWNNLRNVETYNVVQIMHFSAQINFSRAAKSNLHMFYSSDCRMIMVRTAAREP